MTALATAQEAELLADLLDDLLDLPVWTVGDLRRELAGAESRPCDGTPVELFHPTHGSPAAIAAGTEVAVAFCEDCPVRTACLALAMCQVATLSDGRVERTLYGPHGVWGGQPTDVRDVLAPQWHVLQRLTGLAAPAGADTCPACGTPGLEGRRARCNSTCRERLPVRAQRGTRLYGVAA